YELQHIATAGSTFALQTLGQPAIAEGNTILIHETRLGVAEACSGLRMLMTFAAFCTGAVLLMERSRLEKILVLLSAVPIALAANIFRITTTGLAHVWLGSESSAVHALHDLYGWLMMPIGLLCLLLELWLFKHLLITPENRHS
ncbi:MAG TPA: exosortase/archaeosortase family protein, partial [Gemmataceae bacterium]